MTTIIIYGLLSLLAGSVWACIGLWRSLNLAEQKYANYRKAVDAKIDRIMTELQAAESKLMTAAKYELES